MNATRPPIVFAAKNARLVSSAPYRGGQLWMANLKACRQDVLCEVFENVLFVELKDTTYICGIESESGLPNSLSEELALKQQSFIQFLREETRQDNESLGFWAHIVKGYKYSAEGKATAAYLAARNAVVAMGMGYLQHDGGYKLIGVDPLKDGWLESARSILPFDELCNAAQAEWRGRRKCGRF